MTMHWRKTRSDRGAAAVEFALVLPVLLVLVLGIVEFGRIYNVQISVTNAAREGARVMAIENKPAVARAAAVAAAPSVNPAIATANVNVTPASCVDGATATVTITYHVDLITGWFPFLPPVNLTGKGAMLCGG
jgi:Flp pilus assembly protein TadG